MNILPICFSFLMAKTPIDNPSRVKEIENKIDTFSQKFSSVHWVQPHGIDTSQVLWIDVRPEKERRVSQIPYSITKEKYQQLKQQGDLDSLGYWKGRVPIAYCTIGYRSAEYAEEQQKLGLEVQNLSGGVLLWSHLNNSFLDLNGQSTRKVHVYNKSWDLLNTKYESIVD